MDEAQGTCVDCVSLAVAEVFFESCTETFRVLDELSLALLQLLFARREVHVAGHVVHCVQQFLDGACDLFDRLQERLAVANLVWDPAQDLFQCCRFTTEFLQVWVLWGLFFLIGEVGPH